MPEISAASVKALREKTNLPMMECKKALEATGGDESAAIDRLRKQGKKTMETRSGRETSSRPDRRVCRSGEKSRRDDRAALRKRPGGQQRGVHRPGQQFGQATGHRSRRKTADELWRQTVAGQVGQNARRRKGRLSNHIREVFNLARIVRFDGLAGGYVHHNGASGVLIEVEGGNAEVAKDIAMHTAAMRPQAVSKEELDPAVVDKEREILSAAARQEGKPENIIDKMVEGRLRNFYSERVLLEQPFVKDDKKTVGQLAKDAKLTIKKLVHWELGK